MKIQRNTKMKQKNINDIIIKLYIYQLKQYNQLKRVSYRRDSSLQEESIIKLYIFTI